MLLTASYDERHRGVFAMAAYFGGSSLLIASNLEEACAHLERRTVPRHRDAKPEEVERCVITAGLVMLGFDDGWEVCRRLHARNQRIPVLWVVPGDDKERAMGLEQGRLDRCHVTEPVDINVVLAWLDGVLPLRIRIAARSCAEEHELARRQTQVLARRALHERHIACTELANEMGVAESTMREHYGAIQDKCGVHVDRVAARIRRHIGGGEPRFNPKMTRRTPTG